jgi:hypothetical protein
MNEKEKIIGGVFNLNQFFWILGGLILGAVIFVLFYALFQSSMFAAFIGIVFAASGLPFAIYKKNGLTLFQLLYYRHRFKKKMKHLPNMRNEWSEDSWPL